RLRAEPELLALLARDEDRVRLPLGRGLLDRRGRVAAALEEEREGADQDERAGADPDEEHLLALRRPLGVHLLGGAVALGVELLLAVGRERLPRRGTRAHRGLRARPERPLRRDRRALRRRRLRDRLPLDRGQRLRA